jgi:AraC-like DNA-binding protein
LQLHVGVARADLASSLPSRYRLALSTAEQALSQRVSLLSAASPVTAPVRSPLGAARRELGQAITLDPGVLVPRFERYLAAVTAHSGYRFEPSRAHLEAGLEVVVDALRDAGVLDEKGVTELEDALAGAATEAATVSELAQAYRQAVLDIERALQDPLAARQDRSLRRAVAYLREHFGEAPSLSRVARIAGFAPGYFSKVFARTEGVTFREYNQRLRIERAKKMLAESTLSAERVGQLCGFRARNHFNNLFKRVEHLTPGEYRRKVRAAEL